MNTVRKYKRQKYKSKLIYPSKIRIQDYYFGRDIDVSCVCDFTLGISTTGNLFTDFSSSPFVNFVTVLGNSGSFIQHHQMFARYKILNVSCVMTPSDSLSGYNLYISRNSPAIACCCFPTLLNSDPMSLVRDNDNNFIFYGGLNYSQGKQWNFPDNFLSDKNLGIGTWNNCLDYTTQIGEIAFHNTNSSTSTFNRIIASVRIRITIRFSTFSL